MHQAQLCGLLWNFSFSSPINFHLVLFAYSFVRRDVVCTFIHTHTHTIAINFSAHIVLSSRLPPSIELARNYKANVTKCHKIIYMPIAIVKCIVYIYLMVLLPQIDAHQREQIVETTPQIA